MVQGKKVNEITVGGITISIWSATEPQNPTDPPIAHHDFFQIDVGATGDDDWVCIGGGGTGSPAPGNFLTASYPSLDPSGQADWKGWVVASRDHINNDPCFITGYAIGMKIPPLSKQEIISHLKLFSNTSDDLPHPEASCFVEDGYLLLGGGFRVLDQRVGNLGNASFPDSTFSWRARSKDHYYPSPSHITAYAIGIRHTLKHANSEVGNVVTSFHSSVSYGSDLPEVEPLAGMAMCGGGADANYCRDGKYLTSLQPKLEPNPGPTKQSFLALAEMCLLDVESLRGFDTGRTTAYVMGIKITPTTSQPPGGQQSGECDKPLMIRDAQSSTAASDPYPPRNAIDGNSNTKWMSANTTNPSIILNLGGQKQVCKVDITWADGREYHFNILVSLDGNTFTDALTNITRNVASTTESYIFPAKQAGYVKIIITQSIQGVAASIAQISEIRIFSNQT
jgi:hypothetical protein